MVGLLGNVVGVGQAKVGIGDDLRLGPQLVADPADADALHGLDARHRSQHPSHVVDQLGVNAVQEPAVDVTRRALQDEKDSNGDEQPDDGIGQRPSGQHPEGSGDDGKRGEPVGAGVEAIGDEGGGADLERAVPEPDYFSQATQFWASMSDVEKDHIVAAFVFELSKVEVIHVRERMLQNLAEVHAELTERVAVAPGMPAPVGTPDTSMKSSPALSQIPTAPGALDGRVIGILATDGVDGIGVAALVS